MFIFEKPSLPSPDEDGITHINIYSKGKTELGRLLSNFSRTPFTYEPYGYFESAEAFYYWYCTGQKHDDLKVLYGFNAKNKGIQYNSDRIDILGLTCDDFEILQNSLVRKIACNPDIANLLKESTLPFYHYYNYSGKVIIPEGVDWLSEIYEQIRIVLKST